jgi:hypothetical protein
MTDAWRKLFASSVICYAAAFALVLLWSVQAFSLELAVAEFQWSWIMARTWEQFLAFAPIAQAWAVLITFGLVIPIQSNGPAGTSFERFGSSIATVLVLAIAFTLAYGFAHPTVVSRRENMETASAIARELWESAQEARSLQDYEKALSEMEQYVGLVGESEEAQEFLIDVREEVRTDAARLGDAAPVPREEPGAATVDELVMRARAAREDEDFSTAHYMATLALQLDAGNDEAARIAAESLDRLADLRPDESESEASELFTRKLAAKALLSKPVDAYYEFSRLADEYPRDPDVARYLAIAAEGVSRQGVFRDEAQEVLSLPGAGPFVFLNRSSDESRELISIGKLVRVNSGLYAHQVEVIEFSPAGQVLLHRGSDYGKIVGETLVMTVLDSSGERRPADLGEYQGLAHSDTAGLVTLGPTPEELWLLAVASADPAGASVVDLFRTNRDLVQFGLIPDPARAELLRRLSLPFTFLIMSFFTMGFAWRYRSRYLTRPPIPTLILVPLAPLVLMPLYLLLRYAHRILFSALLLWTGFGLAVAVLIAVEAALLLVSLMYLALSSRE